MALYSEQSRIGCLCDAPCKYLLKIHAFRAISARRLSDSFPPAE
jgi:hypothetical protein